MGTRLLSWGLIASVLMLSACMGRIQADEQQEPDRKGKASKADVVEVDLSKLPPDLAEQVRKAISKKKGKQDNPGKKGKGSEKDAYGKKGPGAKKGNESTRQLPPGLAKKSIDHPGRKAWLEAMKKDSPQRLKQKPKKDKKNR